LPKQPSEAVLAIRLFMGPVPVALLVLAILCTWLYPITRERHRALREELATREA
jgi:Na+/melibiose symporter-like transporter